MAALLQVTPAAAQTEHERRSARTAARAGDIALRERRFKDALELFVRAEETVHAPTLVLRIARAYAGLGRYVKAKETYLIVLRESLDEDSPKAFKAAQADARVEIAEVAAKIGTITLSVTGAPREKVSLEFDGDSLPTTVLGLAYPADPGRHTLRVTAEGYLRADRTLLLEDGGATSLAVELVASGAPPALTAAGEESSTPPPRVNLRRTEAPETAPERDGTNWARVGMYAGLGTALVGAVGAVYFRYKFDEKEKQAQQLFDTCKAEFGGTQCPDPNVRDEVEGKLNPERDTAQSLSIGGMIVGGVGLGAAGVFYLLSRELDAPDNSALAPFYSGDTVGMRLSF